MNILVSTDKNSYNEFVLKMLDIFEDYNIKGIAVVALCEGNEDLTGYWNMNMQDKVQARSKIEFDIMDQFITVNNDRYMNDCEGDDTYE